MCGVVCLIAVTRFIDSFTASAEAKSYRNLSTMTAHLLLLNGTPHLSENVRKWQLWTIASSQPKLVWCPAVLNSTRAEQTFERL